VANFSVQSYSINSSASPIAGGTTSGSEFLEYGETPTIIATPNAGYIFVNWTENGTVVSTLASYTFTVTGKVNGNASNR